MLKRFWQWLTQPPIEILPLFPASGFPAPVRDFFIMIPHANRLDLTIRAVKSIEPWWPNVRIVDTSTTWECKDVFPDPIVVEHFPGATFTQVMNLARRKAIDYDYPWYACMHNDAWVESGDLGRFLDHCMSAFAAGSVGYVLTNYDSLVGFATVAAEGTGPWDTNLVQYYSDNDYYRRLMLGGWLREHNYDLIVRHDPSSTLKSEPRRKWFMERVQPHLINYYREKWGGLPGEERYTVAWNGEGFDR